MHTGMQKNNQTALESQDGSSYYSILLTSEQRLVVLKQHCSAEKIALRYHDASLKVVI